MELDHSAGLSTTQIPFKVTVKPVVVLSTVVVGADVSPEATGALVGSEVVTGSAEEGDSEGFSVSFGGVLGLEVGVDEGDTEGVPVGLGVVGEALGSNVGVDVGSFEGDFVGTMVGDCEPSTGEFYVLLGTFL